MFKFKTPLRFGTTTALCASLTLISCQQQTITNNTVDVTKVEVLEISEEMAKVRDYVPEFAVVAHRGSTFWVPEETEAAFRWSRDMGVDYIEADLQCSKDGVILALHDDNLCRTTDIENVYGIDVPRTRKDFYVKYGMSEAEAEAQYVADRASFNPYYANQYMYEELLQLDAGTWFNESEPEQAREAFSTIKQYISTLEDLVMYAQGKRLNRDSNGDRVYSVSGSIVDNSLTYNFEYVDDEQDSGHRPGVYLEFKEPWLNPATFEQDVADELARLDFNIITRPEADDAPFYIDGKVNVGNTNGKVVLQTFSLESLVRTSENFQGKIPMCFLLWWGSSSLAYNTPEGYASYVNLAVMNNAHIIGPSIAGSPNNYPELNEPWNHYLIKKAGLLNHPYSFDSKDQMNKYFGLYNYGNEGGSVFTAPYLDAAFTNRSEMTLQFFIDNNVRQYPAPQDVPDAGELLTKLGY